MTHLHFSPFQFATDAQLAEPKKQVVKERKHLLSALQERKAKTHDLGSTMSCSEAHEVSSLPNAFISPNLPDVMRQSKAVFGAFQD